MQVLAWTDGSGNVNITTPAPGFSIADIARDIPPNASPVAIERDTVPAQRDFRGGWRLQGSAVIEEIEACRQVFIDRVRKQRGPLLAQLDTEYIIADESNNASEKARIAARKQVLRDATSDPRIQNAGSVNALRALDVLA